MKAIIYSDGGCRPTNPGHAAFGAIIKIGDSKHKISRYLGFKTNNQAEFTGVLVSSKYALQLGATQLLIFTDSQLVSNQLSGKWNPKNDDLKLIILETIKFLDDNFEKWNIKWIRREKNQEADGICTDAIYAGMNKNPFFKKTRKGEEIDPFAEGCN